MGTKENECAMYPRVLHWGCIVASKQNYLFYIKQIWNINLVVAIHWLLGVWKDPFEGVEMSFPDSTILSCFIKYFSWGYFPERWSYKFDVIYMKLSMLTSWMWRIHDILTRMEKSKSWKRSTHYILRTKMLGSSQKYFKDS